MEKFKRKIFFWLLVGLFFIAAPVVVMRARGYRFDFSRGVFVHSGTISLKNNPSNLDIYLSGKITDSNLNRINNSYNVTSLMPGSYFLEAKMEGFQTWSKQIDVHSGLASEFWNVLLVRNSYEDISYSTGGFEKFFISPKDQLTALAQAYAGGLKIKILNIKNKSIDNEFFFGQSQFSDMGGEENIEWSPNDDYISVPMKVSVEKKSREKEEKYRYAIIDFSGNSSFILNDFLGEDDIRRVRWDPKEKNYLFFLSGSTLYRANIQNTSDITEIAQDVSSYDLSRTAIYYAQKPNELVFKTAMDGQGEKIQLTSDFPVSLNTPNKKLIVYDDSRIAFLNSSGDFFIYNHGEHDNYFRQLGSGISGMQFSNDGKKIIYWNSNEIFAYYLRDWNVQPTRSENETESITRFSGQIHNVQWLKDYEHIIFSIGGQMKIIELDPRDRRNIMDLPKTNLDSPQIVYNNYLEYLFFTDQRGEVPDLYSIHFPEPVNILGF